MNPDEQKALVFEHLRRRERIAAETRDQLQSPPHDDADPLHGVSDEVRRQAEDEFYEAQGKRRYVTSDGRTLFLTPEEIAQRRHVRSQRRRRRGRSSYYGMSSGERNRVWLTWGFNILAVGMALVVVYLILR